MSSNNYKFGFIGFGNMGMAIISGALDSKRFNSDDFMLYTPSKKSNEAAEKKYPSLHRYDSVDELVNNADIIVLCAKPQMYKTILDQIKERLSGKALLSIAAGLDTKHLISIAGEQARVIRTMPNIAAKVHSSCTLISTDNTLEQDEYAAVEKLFSSIGTVVALPERLIDSASAIAGSGSAFVSLFLESFVESGVLMGIDRKTSEALAKQMLLGSANYLIDSDDDIETMRKNVCSPAGTSIVGIKTLIDEGMPSAVMNAIINTAKRCKEISQEQKQG